MIKGGTLLTKLKGKSVSEGNEQKNIGVVGGNSGPGWGDSRISKPRQFNEGEGEGGGSRVGGRGEKKGNTQ